MIALLASRGLVALTPDAFRALVHSGDKGAVAEALQAAIGEDASSADEPMRALFVVFRDLHPKVDDFAKAWLADAPGDPLAETARVWQIYAQAGA